MKEGKEVSMHDSEHVGSLDKKEGSFDQFWGSVDPRTAGPRLATIISNNPACFDSYDYERNAPDVWDHDLIIERANWASGNYPSSDTRNEWFFDVVVQKIIPKDIPQGILDKEKLKERKEERLKEAISFLSGGDDEFGNCRQRAERTAESRESFDKKFGRLFTEYNISPKEVVQQAFNNVGNVIENAKQKITNPKIIDLRDEEVEKFWDRTWHAGRGSSPSFVGSKDEERDISWRRIIKEYQELKDRLERLLSNFE